MKGIPVLKSKLVMPQMPSAATVSERLRDLIQAMHQKAIILITAPAGYGKTTLAATALSAHKAKGGRISWYRLDEADRDLAFFYTHLVETLFPEEEGEWEEARGHLAACGDLTAQHQYLNALFCQELWAFHTRYPHRKTFLVLDDFQQVRDVAEITGTIRFFMDNLPENCALVISSRCETGLLTAKRRLEKNILEIAREELRLTPEELGLLMRDRTGITPDQALLRKIMLYTEGWAAGIVLTCQMLNKAAPAEVGLLLDRSGPKELLFQYIISEALTAIDDRLLRFLARTAILPEFSAAEASAVFGEQNALALLEKCREKGLFIEKLHGSPATYRFHSLFREALQQIALRLLAPEEVKSDHLKAAAYCIEHQLFERAIEHFMACGNVNLAVELIARDSVRLLAFEAVEQLRLWFDFLPEEVVSNNAHLLYIKSYIYYQREIDEAQSLLDRALALFRQAGDNSMQVYVLIAMSHLYVQRHDIQSIKNIQAQMARLAGPARGQPLQGMLTVFDFTASVWEEDYTAATALARRIKALDLTAEWRWMALYYAAMMSSMLGELEQAERQILQVLDLDIIKRADLLKGYSCLYYCIVLQLEDRLPPQSQALEELMTTGAKHDYKYLLGFGKRLEANIKYHRCDLSGALELLDESSAFFEELGNTSMMLFNRLSHCLWLCGNRDNARELLEPAQKAMQDLSTERGAFCLQEIGLSILGTIAAEAEDYGLAEKYLTMAVERSQAKGVKQILCFACLPLAKLYFARGEGIRGEALLRQAFALAAQKKYYVSWNMHLPTLVEMAARCVQSGLYPDYVQELVLRHFGCEAAGFFVRTAAMTTDACLKEFAVAFIARYGGKNESRDFSVSINLLGRLSIMINGTAIPDKEWKTKKIAGLLKFLAAHRGQPVSKDRLMEVFWPEADKKSAMVSLRAALYELKKVLRRYGLDTERLGLVLNEKRETLEILAGSYLEIDVDLFLDLSNQFYLLSQTGSSGEQRRTVLEQMLAVYRGNFLEEELYEDWTFVFREELWSIYSRAALALASIHTAEKNNDKAEKLLLKLLDMDPYNEKACFLLLELYFSDNQRGRAVKLYTDFAKRFEKDLQIKPDQKLTALLNGR